MQYLVRKWKRASRVGSPVMGGTVDLQQGYAPNSNSFSLLCINTKSRVNGSGPFNSHASSPLHSSVHQSPYSPSYLSSSFTQTHLLNGASPYHSLGGASSGYHVNSNGVTNGNSSYQAVGGISDSYHVNSNFSVHTTPPTRDYSSKPHPTSENSGARRKIISSSSPNPTIVGHSSPALRVMISEPSRLHISTRESTAETQRDGFGYSKIKVISLKIGVRTREPCYKFVLTLTLSDFDLHWLNNILFTCNNHKSCHFQEPK